MAEQNLQRVVVSGIGIITSIGESLPAFRQGLFNGACGIGPVTLFDTSGFPCQLAAQVQHENLKSFFAPRETKRMSRCDLLGLIAAREAFSDASLTPEVYEGKAISVILGAGAGSMLSWERYRRSTYSGKARTRPSVLLSVPQCTLTDSIANRYRLCGHRATIATACSSSATAIGYGFDLIRSGDSDIVVTGGSESLTELTFAGFNSLRLMDSGCCRPFDKNRRGLSLGEGAAMLMLESYEHARKRNATVYAEVLGYAVNADAYNMTSPDPEAAGMSAVMAAALVKAGLSMDRVDYINAHGTGTQINDAIETIAIKKVFGHRHALSIAVSSTKSMVGHCLGASGAIEAAATVLAIAEQIAPPTLHVDTPDPACDLDYVPGMARKQPIRTALSNSFAFGGNNTCLVFGRAPMPNGKKGCAL